jgi:hypothetical protein
MIIYNVTCSVDREIAEDWVTWMKDKHIPELLKTGLFYEYRILKVLSHDDPATFSFAVQYHAKNIEDVDIYLLKHAPRLRADVSNRYGEKVVAFRTLLEEV